MWEVKKVKSELMKLVGIDLDSVDAILRKLLFFRKFDQTTRVELFKKARIVQYKANQYVIFYYINYIYMKIRFLCKVMLDIICMLFYMEVFLLF